MAVVSPRRCRKTLIGPRDLQNHALSLEQVRQRIETIEESYEFFLAYAAQGLTREGASRSGGEVRRFLERTEEALTGLADAMASVVDSEGLEPPEPYRDMIDVLRRDADATRAAVRLVLAQDGISSQLIDNLNASIHVRALLTDLFLLDEVLGGV